MYLYVELWKARQAWRDMSRGERETWLNKTLASLKEHLQLGTVEPMGLSVNDADTPHTSGYDFFAVWKMTDENAAREFEKFVENVGWHQYFEQVNARGRAMELPEFASRHLDEAKAQGVG